MRVIKNSVRQDYETYVKRKVVYAKQNLIRKWMKRSDYKAILYVQSYEQMDHHSKHFDKVVQSQLMPDEGQSQQTNA